MPARSKEEREKRRLEALERKKERDAKKQAAASKAAVAAPGGGKGKKSKESSGGGSSGGGDSGVGGPSPLVGLPPDALAHALCHLPSRELGAATSTCRTINRALRDARVGHLLARVNRGDGEMMAGARMCENQGEVRDILQRSLGGGNTRRMITQKSRRGEGADEYVSYARFVEEGICGYATQSFGGKSTPLLPPIVNGRYASCSPEHTLCRVGGAGAQRGAGGSGVSSWGVGKRGQLGHGKREDEAIPRMLVGGIGYRVRVVQVSAGGGLVRVAHSLLLTESGRVLSFGMAQYGQLGHGYSAGKQLSDEMRPRYIDALSGVRVTCVSAGELHSAVCTSDGDVYTWGDGFCGQLGLGNKRPQLLPVQVEAGGLEDECVSAVSCGNRHTLCVTDEGEVFSFGLGHFGALGRAFTPFEYDADAAIGDMGGEDGEMMPPPGAAMPAAAPPMGQNVAEVAHIAQQDDLGFMSEETRAHLDLLANLTLDDSSDQCIPTVIDSLEGIRIMGASAGHRHSLFLDSRGNIYSCGAGMFGELGHGDFLRQEFPTMIKEFAQSNQKVLQMSAGVDMSMAVTTSGDVYGWGKADDGRLGLGLEKNNVPIPRRVVVPGRDGDAATKAVDVECGYVHSVVVALDGTVHVCGGVGTDGRDDGQYNEEDLGDGSMAGRPVPLSDFNIWHRIPEPKEKKSTKRWKKYGKYEVKGRAGMMSEAKESS